MKTLAIIGSTGSIGKSTLKVFNNNQNKFKLIYLATYQNKILLDQQIKKYNPNFYYLFKKNISNELKKKKFKCLNYFIRKKIKIDYVVSGVSSFESLKINFDLLKISKKLLIANKETLICGGNIFMKQALRENCKIIPIDSEHHCLDFFLNSFDKKDLIKKYYLVASGGPFFDKKIKKNEKLENVIKHPNWSMGKKISIDSSTLANKVLELFEAKVLFGIKKEKLDIVVEKSSKLHAIILFKNNLSFFISHYPDMIVPISNALDVSNKKNIDFSKFNINLKSPPLHKFPIVKLGFYILKNLNDSGMIIFTVLNERLVNLYINNKLSYSDISKKLVKLFKKNEIVNSSNKCIKSKLDIFKTIKFANSIKL